MMNQSNIPKYPPQRYVSSRPQAIGDLIRTGVITVNRNNNERDGKGLQQPRPGEIGRGYHELISSYQSRGSLAAAAAASQQSRHVLAAAETVSSSLNSLKSSSKKSFIPVPVGHQDVKGGSTGASGESSRKRSNDNESSSGRSRSGSLLSLSTFSPRRFFLKEAANSHSSRRSERSHVTSSPRSGSRRDQLQEPSRSSNSNVRSVTTRIPQGGGVESEASQDNLMAHHTSHETETVTKLANDAKDRRHRLTSNVVLKKKSSTYPELKKIKSPTRPKTASDKQCEWKMKYGKLVRVESARMGKVKPCSISSLSQVVTPVISKPLEETKKSLMHLEALKNSLKKNSSRESYLPFLPSNELVISNEKKDQPSPKQKLSLKTVKEVGPRSIPIRRGNPPIATAQPLSPLTRSIHKKREIERKLNEKKLADQKERSKPKRRETETALQRETRRASRKKEGKSKTPATPATLAHDTEGITAETQTVDIEFELFKLEKENLSIDNGKLNNNGSKEIQEKTRKETRGQSNSANEEVVVPCKRCKQLEARAHRRINDLVTENKSLTFMLGQKRSLVHSLQNQVKALATENQKLGLRLMICKKKNEKLEQQVLQSMTVPAEQEPPPPPPVTPVASSLLPSTPAELESKVNQLTHDLRALQVANEKSSSFLSSILTTLSSLGYESLTDPSGNEIDLRKCAGDKILEIKGRDPTLPKQSSLGGGDSSYRPRRLASGQELMLKAVIGSQEDFIRRMSVQFQDLHRSNFIRGVVRQEEEVAETVLDLLERSVRFCPSVMSVFTEQLALLPAKSSQAMEKIMERLGTMREAKFTPTVSALGFISSEGNKDRTTGGGQQQHQRERKDRGGTMMRSSTSGLDNQPSEEEEEGGKSRKCLLEEDDKDEKDCPAGNTKKDDNIKKKKSWSGDDHDDEVT